jgi:hypothetical protein
LEEILKRRKLRLGNGLEPSPSKQQQQQQRRKEEKCGQYQKLSAKAWKFRGVAMAEQELSHTSVPQQSLYYKFE